MGGITYDCLEHRQPSLVRLFLEGFLEEMSLLEISVCLALTFLSSVILTFLQSLKVTQLGKGGG